MAESDLKSRPYRWIALGALAVWIVVLLASPRPYDFIVYFAIAKILLRHPHTLYSLTTQVAAERAVAISHHGFLAWAHPAPEALLFAPLTLLNFRWAFAVASAITIGMILLSGYLLREEILSLSRECRYALLVFLFYPAASGLLGGQDIGLFLLLWALAWRSWKSGDQFTSGLWIGLSLIRYQFAVPMLLFFLALRAWKLFGGVIVSACALLAGSFLLVGPNLVPSYLHTLHFLAEVNDGVALPSMPTIRGLAGWLLPSHSLVAAAVGVAALLAWALVKVRGMSRLSAFSFAMVISQLVDPHAFLYEIIVLAIPLTAFLRIRPNAAILAFLVCALGFASRLSQIGNPAAQFLHTEDFAVICPVLLVWAIWMAHAYTSQPAIATPVAPGDPSIPAPPDLPSDSDLAIPSPLLNSQPNPPQR